MKDYRHHLFLGAEGYQFEIAKQLRRDETDAEKLLWSRLRNKQLGVKFRRQHPLYCYIVDFYCHSHRLVIEIDGSIQNTIESTFDDNIRSQAFKEFNIGAIRFNNDDVLFDIESVLNKIKSRLANR